MDGYIKGWMVDDDRWMIDEWVDGWMDGWMIDEWIINGWIDV